MVVKPEYRGNSRISETITDAPTASNVKPSALETDKGTSFREVMIQSGLHGDVESGSEMARRLTNTRQAVTMATPSCNSLILGTV